MFRELTPVRQFAYVVDDIERAMQHWVDVLGIGPFFYFEHVPVQDFNYLGKPTKAKLGAAYANTGKAQIELVTPLDDEPSAFSDFLKAHGPGAHHMAYWTQDFDFWEERCTKAGLNLIHTGYTGTPEGRFMYVGTELHPGTVIEVSEVRGWKAEFFKEIALEAERWNGTNGIRLATI